MPIQELIVGQIWVGLIHILNTNMEQMKQLHFLDGSNKFQWVEIEVYQKYNRK